ncbi:MAG: acyloxyacyl hydrolase [Bacteroidota bacterium]|nr:acyloxyacyl hydrolase [Bacteroidota bacterium]
MRKLVVFAQFLILPAFFFYNPVQAQFTRLDSIILKNRIKIEFVLDIGNVLPTNTFVRLKNTDTDGLAHYNGYSLRLARQTTGDQLWQQIYGYPSFGVGVYSAFFTNTQNLGNPIATYGFFNAPFFKINRFSLNYELGLGLTFNWNHYDPLTNPDNTAISTDKSVYIDAGLSLRYLLSQRLSVNLGYGLTHYSNGRLKLPNFGLNTGATKVSLSYDLFDNPIQYQSQLKPSYTDHFEWILSAYGGERNVTYLGTLVDLVTQMKGINYLVFGISNTINRQIDYKSKIGIGFTMEYNGSQSSQIIVENGKLDELDMPFGRHLALSIFPSYELVIDRLSLIIQPGFYLYRKKAADMTPGYYQRIGVKYHFLKNTFFGISLRAYDYYKSDFIEWTVGHRLAW